MASITGSLSICSGKKCYTLCFPHHGWLAADMVQYLGDLYASEDRRIGILRLLGYTLEMNASPPPRAADHWVELDLDERTLATNSDLIRRAVNGEPPREDEPYLELSLKNIYQILDDHDFTVRLYL